MMPVRTAHVGHLISGWRSLKGVNPNGLSTGGFAELRLSLCGAHRTINKATKFVAINLKIANLNMAAMSHNTIFA